MRLLPPPLPLRHIADLYLLREGNRGESRREGTLKGLTGQVTVMAKY